MRLRDIKFRGIRIDNGEWSYGDLLDHGKNARSTNPAIVERGECVIPKSHDVDSITVGQFINRCDVTGKEIYEGDKVKIYDDSEPSNIYRIKWNNKSNGFVMIDENNNKFEITNMPMEVVGDIHEDRHEVLI